ncbi:WD40 repeat-like protein [Rickenella mellea]|uniref:WD40 repeat-like protein n=1 Tax=Rickenella mellea TaxID=50990 RepID=A0A4Y7Q5Q2_9AGAM|nr:WD40 repeat-like protein [Rickenella mellea]
MGRLQAPVISPGFQLNDPAVSITGGSVTPTRMDSRAASKRKQTLMSLLDALNELKNEEDFDYGGAKQSLSVEVDEGPTIDDHLQSAGAETFNKFQKRINNLDRELRNFANASRQLGSSVGILSSSFHLRERLARVLFLFRENAAGLFPRKVSRQPIEVPVNQDAHKMRHRKARRRVPPHTARPVVMEKLDAEDFPYQLSELARDVTNFLKSLNEFPEFTDEALDHSISLFEGDLKYWASCLRTYEGQFRFPSVQRYLHDITSEMEEHLDTITSSLTVFLEVGIPTIRFAQKHGAANLLNLTTVATFFSAVTATTLQFSYNQTGTKLSDGVNGFWFCSLVFSIASAVNSLLGLTWKQAMYRSPGHRVPWWVLIWIKRSPLIFLVVSVAAFSIGLCMFAYSSNQHLVTSTLTTIFTAFSSFGLMAVSAWFAFERWTFTRHRGKKWLMDVLAEIRSEIYRIPLVRWIRKVPKKHAKKVGGGLRRASTSLSRVASRMSTSGKAMAQEKSECGGDSPVHVNSRLEGMPVTPLSLSTPLPSPTSEIPQTLAAPSMFPAPSLSVVSDNGTESAVTETGPVTTPAKSRWTSAVKTVMMLRTTSANVSNNPLTAFSPAPRRQRTSSTNVSSGVGDSRGAPRQGTDQLVAVRGNRLHALVPALKNLEPTQELLPHVALVRHLQFSPNGKFLATCSWDRTCQIFNVGESFTVHRILAHPQGFVGQVAWSPTGNLLLTKMNRGVKVWATESGVCTKTIDRHRAVQSVTWCPGGEAFMSVEESGVTKLDLNGKVLDSCHFDSMKLHDVAVTPDNARILCVATLLSSADGLQPRKSRAEKQIIVYNLEEKEIENQVPVLNDVRDITLAKNGTMALVSYENKAPPQLWRVDHIKPRPGEAHEKSRLSLQQTYMPRTPVDFAGPSYFGGKDDQLVLCAGKAGDINIWERDTALLLHHIRAQDLDGDLTCIAWNHDALMFCTGSHDGAVRIWTTRPSSAEEQEDSATNGHSQRHQSVSQSFLSESGTLHRSESPTQEDFDSKDPRDERTPRSSTEDRGDRRTILFTPAPQRLVS